MLGWLKQIVGRRPTLGDAPRNVELKRESGTRDPKTVMNVVDEFYQRSRQQTPFGVHALVEAGAADLQSYEEVLEVCRLIVKHCNIDPIMPSLKKDLGKEQLLAFLRWHEANDIEKEEYRNGSSVRALLDRFRTDHSK